MSDHDLGIMSVCKGPMTFSSRVLLVSPPSGVRTQLPLLNLYYLAAALRRAEIEVRVLDLEGPLDRDNATTVAEAVDVWEPHVLGFTLCTETALPAYHLVAALGSREGMTAVAGGPHATARPEEVLEHGFDVAVYGEGEETLVELVTALGAGSSLASVRGLAFRTAAGAIETTEPRSLVSNLDELASPTLAFDLLAPKSLTPTLLTSRGCPGLCTFCANQVFGRKYRCHSVERVLREMEVWHAHTESTTFNFCDAAFTVDRRRLMRLCAGLSKLTFAPTWWCEVRADQLDGEVAEMMAHSGCSTVLIGAESGDPGVLSRIRKGIDGDTTKRALEIAKEHGLRTEVSFMFGFPDETPQVLENTLDFMTQIADVVDLYRPMGIVVPYPGTFLYEEHHERYGFSNWWLDDVRFERLGAALQRLSVPDAGADVGEMLVEMEQVFLEIHPIRHDADVHRAIQDCLAFRHAHNHRDRGGDSDATSAGLGLVLQFGSDESPSDRGEALSPTLRARYTESANQRREELLDALDGRASEAFGGSKPHIGPLSPGCVTCGEGHWSCIFVNAICNGKCFFCPTEMTYKGYPPAAERTIFESPQCYVSYVKVLGFKGVGLSGGEPFLTFDRTLGFLQALRRELGDTVYIWAYTNGIAATPEKLRAFADAGLDELRYNVVATDYSTERIRLAIGEIPRVTVEIPALPEHAEQLRKLIVELADLGVDHLNLHQLMIVGQNAPRLDGRGYTFIQGPAPGAMESELLALEMMCYALDEGLDLAINYCGVAFKERWQYRVDDLRTAKLITEGYETRSKSGLLRRFWVYASPDEADAILDRFRERGYDADLWMYDADLEHLYIHPSLAELVDGWEDGLKLRYYKTILGHAGVGPVAVPYDQRRIDVGSACTISVGLHRLGPPIPVTVNEVEQLLAGEVPEQLRQFEEVEVGLPAYR